MTDPFRARSRDHNSLTAGAGALKWLLYAPPLVGLGYGIYGWGAFDTAQAVHTARATTVASGMVLVLLIMLHGAQLASGVPARKHYGPLGVVLGADGRLSTSKTQVALWTYGLVYASLYLAFVAAFIHGAQTFDQRVWDDYLVLLGGPFGAAVLAKGIVVGKLNNGQLSQSPTAAADVNAVRAGTGNGNGTTIKPAARDIVASDNGTLDLVDTQYLLFNIVAFTYATAVFLSQQFNHQVTGIDKYGLPQIPGVLLALTSASAATYVANKTVRNTAPKISRVVQPATLSAGNSQIIGVNLVPPGMSSDQAKGATTISIVARDASASAVVAPESAAPGKLEYSTPAALASKTCALTVMTAAGVATDPYPLTIPPA